MTRPRYGELTMHYRPGPGPNAPIVCGVTHGCVTAELADVSCVDCKRSTGPVNSEPAAALTDRRQRAIEAFDDALAPPAVDVTPHHIREREGWAERLFAARATAIETATRVRVDDEIIRAAYPAAYLTPRQRLIAAFRAAGFEVEQ